MPTLVVPARAYAESTRRAWGVVAAMGTRVSGRHGPSCASTPSPGNRGAYGGASGAHPVAIHATNAPVAGGGITPYCS